MQSLSSTKIFAITNFFHNPLEKKILGGKLFQAFNLNPLLKLLSYPMVTTCNNLPHKICCKCCKNKDISEIYNLLPLPPPPLPKWAVPCVVQGVQMNHLS